MLFTQSAGNFQKRKNSINLGGELIDFSVPIVMGIINVTPDSFYDGGKMEDEKVLLSTVEKMIKEGAAIIDIGAISTRPGAQTISTKIELGRLLPAIQVIRKNFPKTPISVDTFRSWVAVRVIDEIGPIIVNDISGGTLDSKMFETIGKMGVPYILSHIQGTPGTMQDNPQYDDIIKDITNYFSEVVKRLTKLGVADVIIDPGFGFGKNLEHNYELLNRLDSFKVFQLPVMVGLSRKSMIWKTLDIKPDAALNGTTVANTLALMGGADILRVHDVKEATEAIKIISEIKSTIK
ncbi:MAG: dihydropteroate synthase [Prolixibacteraceae bacterium]|jgi:dihydropteroate synthase|nr:dihydropteroate synthase [Prolixibacteraceae bacterium]MBT6765793.1 dihydropteroate synthase [Prolixibacteraceae bacterium]MBT6997634.1 dihydropteroate synthase [Prolixibacteraceae bacterium]MBT7394941.1 dihydropteroate synthase [Prolixibacteraceae bacterium]